VASCETRPFVAKSSEWSELFIDDSQFSSCPEGVAYVRRLSLYALIRSWEVPRFIIARNEGGSLPGSEEGRPHVSGFATLGASMLGPSEGRADCSDMTAGLSKPRPARDSGALVYTGAGGEAGRTGARIVSGELV